MGHFLTKTEYDGKDPKERQRKRSATYVKHVASRPQKVVQSRRRGYVKPAPVFHVCAWTVNASVTIALSLTTTSRRDIRHCGVSRILTVSVPSPLIPFPFLPCPPRPTTSHHQQVPILWRYDVSHPHCRHPFRQNDGIVLADYHDVCTQVASLVYHTDKGKAGVCNYT